MHRREFIKLGSLVGTILLASPGISFGTGRARLRVSLGDTLGYEGRVAAQRYLALLAQALGASASIVSDGDTSASQGTGAGEDVLDLVISSHWKLGSALSALVPVHEAASDATRISVIREAPLCICVNRHMPRTWAALAQSSARAGEQLRCALPAGDGLLGMLATDLFQQAGLPAPVQVHFRGGYQILPALVGAKIALGIVPLDLLTMAGRPGWYGDVLSAHRRGDISVLASAGPARIGIATGLPTLNDVFGQPGHEAVLTTVVSYQGPHDGPLIKQIKAASDKMVGEGLLGAA